MFCVLYAWIGVRTEVPLPSSKDFEKGGDECTCGYTESAARNVDDPDETDADVHDLCYNQPPHLKLLHD